MISLSYTITAGLKQNLEAVDNIRVTILTTPISPKGELKLRWETILDHIYYSLSASGSSLSKKDMLSMITASSILKKPKNLTRDEKDVLKYKKALNLITQNWTGSEKEISEQSVILLHELASPGSHRKNDKELKQILAYLQTFDEHAVIQAAIAYAAILRVKPFTDGNARIARLLSLLYLYRKGYDCRGLICLEKYWHHNKDQYEKALAHGLESSHMTIWIEYFALSLVNQLQEKLEEIQKVRMLSVREKNFVYLNDRQRDILSLLDNPAASISNRIVQKHFGISQITASRDLGKLATLGLLAVRGKGRSVYYTKV